MVNKCMRYNELAFSSASSSHERGARRCEVRVLGAGRQWEPNEREAQRSANRREAVPSRREGREGSREK